MLSHSALKILFRIWRSCLGTKVFAWSSVPILRWRKEFHSKIEDIRKGSRFKREWFFEIAGSRCILYYVLTPSFKKIHPNWISQLFFQSHFLPFIKVDKFSCWSLLLLLSNAETSSWINPNLVETQYNIFSTTQSSSSQQRFLIRIFSTQSNERRK